MKDYKKILKGIVNIINTTEKSDIGFANICSYIGENCPELKKSESEDEKIRKAILNYFIKCWGNCKDDVCGIHVEDAIAWLEKQAEHANFRNNIQVGDRVTRNEAGVLVNISQLNRIAKPRVANKVEPKFKVGDIVKHKNNPHLTYILKRFTDDGDYEFHAIGKDGNEGETCFAVVRYQDEWELVEQKPAECRQETKPNGGIVYEDFNEGDSSYKVNLEYLSKSQVELIENIVASWQTSANNSVEWSEEDEKMVDKILTPLAVRYSLSEYQPMYDWLKSLKDRIQSQSQWKPSEKQIIVLQEAIGIVGQLTPRGKCLKELVEQLKKLREE